MRAFTNATRGGLRRGAPLKRVYTGPEISRILGIFKILKNPRDVLDLYNLRNFAEFPGRPGPGPGRGSSSAAPRIWNLKEFKIWPPGPGPGPPAIYN